jgi:translation elongation factor EF-Tu-like GTPase
MHNMSELTVIHAKIELFSGHKMRTTPFVSGYRPVFDFSGEKTKISGKIDLINTDTFLPGMVGVVKISFIKGIISDIHFKVGKTFSFGEGVNPLGKGEITEVISSDKRSQSF